MINYLVLSLATLLIVALGYAAWRKTRSLSVPVGVVFLYFWTLQGAWMLVYDVSHGNALEAGANRDYLEDKLFAVHVDATYLATLLIYAAFLLMVLCTFLWFAEGRAAVEREASKRVPHGVMHISHARLLTIAAIACATSYWIVMRTLQGASHADTSAYLFTRQNLPEETALYTLHQVLNRVAVLAIAVGLAVGACGKNARYVAGRTTRWAMAGYALVAVPVFAFLTVLGNRMEFLIASVVGILLYFANHTVPKRRTIVLAGMVCLAGIFLIDFLRAYPLLDRSDAISSAFNPSQVFAFVLTSNEMFASHISLYGVLRQEVPPTHGTSVVSLAASIVPRVLWPGRPPDIYEYYVDRVNATPGQGYTIHHATGWYLNFGFAGVLAGGALLGWLWAKCWNGSLRPPSRHSRLYRALFLLAPFTFVAHLPAILRSGPEGYKSLLIEGLLIPAVILAWSAGGSRHASAVMHGNRSLQSSAVSG